jgi:hydroxylaminobenzene mutase
MSVQRGGRQILIHGIALVLVGLLWGLVVPHTPYPRLALVAHIQFETNGLLFIVVMLFSVWLIWLMALSEAANAWWGANQMLPIAASQAAALGGAAWQELLVKLTHIGAGVGIIVAWTLLLIGVVKGGTVE